MRTKILIPMLVLLVSGCADQGGSRVYSVKQADGYKITIAGDAGVKEDALRKQAKAEARKLCNGSFRARGERVNSTAATMKDGKKQKNPSESYTVITDIECFK